MRETIYCKDVSDVLPIDEMRTYLVKCLELARKKHPPSDGSMHFLDVECVLLNGGMWEPNGWKLEATTVCDERIDAFREPAVVVHAYHGSMMSLGRISAPIEYTPEDRRALARQSIAALQLRRQEIDAAIVKLREVHGIQPDEGAGDAECG